MTTQTETIVEKLEWRYATKKFDSSKKIDADTWNQLERSLVLAPSSYGLQPWKFVVVTDQKVKDKLPEASFNQPQPKDCSHLVVFCRLNKIDHAHVESYVEHMAKTRNTPVEKLEGAKSMMLGFVDRTSEEERAQWMEKQCYIALGTLISAASALGIDNCPMEGLNRKQYDEILKLPEHGCTSLVMCALGYRAQDDKYANYEKVRFDHSDVIIRV